MATKIKIGDKEINTKDLSDIAKGQAASLQFANDRLKELINMQALLNRAKNSYLQSLKQEMLSSKAGYLLNDD